MSSLTRFDPIGLSKASCSWAYSAAVSGSPVSGDRAPVIISVRKISSGISAAGISSTGINISAGFFTGSISSKSVDKPPDSSISAAFSANGHPSSAILSAEQANHPSKLRLKTALSRLNLIFDNARNLTARQLLYWPTAHWRISTLALQSKRYYPQHQILVITLRSGNPTYESVKSHQLLRRQTYKQQNPEQSG